MQLKTRFDSVVVRQSMSPSSPVPQVAGMTWCVLSVPATCTELAAVQPGFCTWINRLLCKHMEMLLFVRHTIKFEWLEITELNKIIWSVFNVTCITFWYSFKFCIVYFAYRDKYPNTMLVVQFVTQHLGLGSRTSRLSLVLDKMPNVSVSSWSVRSRAHPCCTESPISLCWKVLNRTDPVFSEPCTL